MQHVCESCMLQNCILTYLGIFLATFFFYKSSLLQDFVLHHHKANIVSLIMEKSHHLNTSMQHVSQFDEVTAAHSVPIMWHRSYGRPTRVGQNCIDVGVYVFGSTAGDVPQEITVRCYVNTASLCQLSFYIPGGHVAVHIM